MWVAMRVHAAPGTRGKHLAIYDARVKDIDFETASESKTLKGKQKVFVEKERKLSNSTEVWLSLSVQQPETPTEEVSARATVKWLIDTISEDSPVVWDPIGRKVVSIKGFGRFQKR
jgi:hypothetical protein